jgi:hypothetical protein
LLQIDPSTLVLSGPYKVPNTSLVCSKSIRDECGKTTPSFFLLSDELQIGLSSAPSWYWVLVISMLIQMLIPIGRVSIYIYIHILDQHWCFQIVWKHGYFFCKIQVMCSPTIHLCLTFFYDIVVTLIWKHGKLLSVCCWHVIFSRVHLSLGSQTPM